MGDGAFDLNGLKMHATVTAPGGVIDRETIFEFTQIGARVEASYAGGRVVTGSLIGLVSGATLEFRYCQLHDGDTLAGGQSRCDLERDDSAKVRIVERFTWADGGSGENVISEL